MIEFKQSIANFICIKCSRTWSGVIYQNFCLDCTFDSSNKIDEKDKMILRLNIRSIKDIELKKEYKRLYKLKFQAEDDSHVQKTFTISKKFVEF